MRTSFAPLLPRGARYARGACGARGAREAREARKYPQCFNACYALSRLALVCAYSAAAPPGCRFTATTSCCTIRTCSASEHADIRCGARGAWAVTR